jgi:hypothetical protein
MVFCLNVLQRLVRVVPRVLQVLVLLVLMPGVLLVMLGSLACT